MTVEVVEVRRPDGETWYRVLVNGRDRNAEWADPDAARRHGEQIEAEQAGGGGTVTQIETPETPEEQTLPEEPTVVPTPAETPPTVVPDDEPEERPKPDEENGDDSSE